MAEVPFHYIRGLPREAQNEIDRNFDYIMSQLNTGGVSTLYDAIIDPSATSSSSTHIYKNLTDLVAGESMTSTRLFSIAVISRTTNISETSNITLSGNVSIHAIGMQESAANKNLFGDQARPVWDLNGHTVTGGAIYWLSVEGLDIWSSAGSVTNPFVNLHMKIVNCKLSTTPSPYNAGARKWTGGVTDKNLIAYGSAFYDFGVLANGTTYMDNCLIGWLNGSLAATTLSITTETWIKNTVVQFFGVAGSGITLTHGAGTDVYLDLIAAINLYDGSGGTLPANLITINAAGNTYVEVHGDYGRQPAARATVTAGSGDVSLKGDAWGSIIISGNTNNKLRLVDVAIDSASGGGSVALDVTGPAMVKAHIRASSGANAKSIFRGDNIRADLYVQGTGNPFIACIGLLDSLITADLNALTVGSQAYTVDAASARNYLILSGTGMAAFTVASANASATTRVGTEAAGS